MNIVKKDFFRELESASAGDEIQFADLVENLAFNDAGLLPAIAQDVETGEVLMLAWMNREALEATIATGNMTYWSRSRQSLWIKGETSGHYQKVKSISFDCDGDTILCQVKQEGSACHTVRKTCFYLQLDENGNKIVVSSSSGK